MGLAKEQVWIIWHTNTCGKCGITYQVPEYFDKDRREGGGNWYCPNGHSRVYKTREVDRLKVQLEAERGRTEFARRRLKNEINSHRATKGHVTRQKNRAAAGVCPCCNRTFKGLARHMANKHPDYAE